MEEKKEKEIIDLENLTEIDLLDFPISSDIFNISLEQPTTEKKNELLKSFDLSNKIKETSSSEQGESIILTPEICSTENLLTKTAVEKLFSKFEETKESIEKEEEWERIYKQREKSMMPPKTGKEIEIPFPPIQKERPEEDQEFVKPNDGEENIKPIPLTIWSNLNGIKFIIQFIHLCEKNKVKSVGILILFNSISINL